MTDRPTFKDHDYFMKDKTDYTSRAVFQEHVRHTNDKTRGLRDDTKELQIQTEELQVQTDLLHQEMRDYHGELDAVIEGNLIQTKVDERVEQKYNDLDQQYKTQLNGLTAQLAHTAKQAELEATGRRIDELIIGSGNANAEVTDARVSVTKNKVFPTIGKRFEDSEKEVKEIIGDQMPITNLVIDPKFSQLSNWTVHHATATVVDGVATVKAAGSHNVTRILQNVPAKPTLTEKHYAGYKAKILSGTPRALRILFHDWAPGGTLMPGLYVDYPEVGKVYDIDRIISSVKFVGDVRFYVEVEFAGATGTYEVWNPMVINLTKTYGVAKEPTINEFRQTLTEFGGFIEGTKTLLSNRKLLSIIKEKTDNVEMPMVTGKEIVRTGSYTRQKKVLWTITYDDESKSIYDHAYPVHQAVKAPGLFYVVPDRVDNGGFYDWGDADNWIRIKEMSGSGLIEIGHHTVRHPSVVTLNEKQLRENIEEGFERFKRQGIYPKHFAYPYGANNAMNRNVLRDYFVSATTVRFNPADPEGFDMHPMAIDRRIGDAYFVNFQRDLDTFIANGEGWLLTYMHAIHPDGKINGKLGVQKCWTPTQLQTMIQYARSKGVEIVTMDEGLKTYAPYTYYYNEQIEPIHAVQRNGVVINNPII